jgi:hypothetical protein
MNETNPPADGRRHRGVVASLSSRHWPAKVSPTIGCAPTVRLGLRHGLDEDALTALTVLLASYIGYPRASLAMETIKDECAHPLESR